MLIHGPLEGKTLVVDAVPQENVSESRLTHFKLQICSI